MANRVEVAVVGRKSGAAGRWAVPLFADEIAVPAVAGRELRSAIAGILGRSGWTGAGEQSAESGDGASGVVHALGVGKRGDFDRAAASKFVRRAVEAALVAGTRQLRIVLPDHEAVRGVAGAERAARAAALAAYRFETYLSSAKSAALERCELLPPPSEYRAYARGTERARAVTAGAILARDLGNSPPNLATPEWIARQAAKLARRHRARIQVLGPAELKRRGMGGILAVGGGSSNPPRLVRIEIGRGQRTAALVGKGITFDTGGISIKPAAQMEEMKWDKCGACTVLGVLEAAALLDLPVRLRAYLALAENMPGGEAYRPGDIIRCANGKTVEILNTDAEGRMVLADALSWASAERPDALIELSTLTGACVVALGTTGAGLFTPDDRLAGDLLASAEAVGERLWRLPLWREFGEAMKGSHSDLKNSGGRWGGASTAAAFLSQFVAAPVRWAHLDIAGPAYVGTGGAAVRGATGFGVALVVDWLTRFARRATA